MSPENAQKLLRLLERDAKDFGWGKIVHRVYTSPSQRKSILRNYNKVSIENVKKQAYLIWGNKYANFHSQFPEDMQVEDIDPEKDILGKEIFFLPSIKIGNESKKNYSNINSRFVQFVATTEKGVCLDGGR